MTIVISSVLLMSKQETSRILVPIQSAANSNQVMAPPVETPKDSHMPKLAVSSVVHALVPRPVMPGSPGTACCVPVVLWGMLLVVFFSLRYQANQTLNPMLAFGHLAMGASLSSFFPFFFCFLNLFYVIAACSNFTHACPNTAAIKSIKLLGIKQNEKASLMMC